MATSVDERDRLHKAGFVRVDGLWWYYPAGPEHGFLRWGGKIHYSPNEFGRWGYNNGVDVVVTLDGEAWLGMAAPAASEECYRRRVVLTREMCPHGTGLFVPCSNGEFLLWDQILYRLADPDWKPEWEPTATDPHQEQLPI